MYGYVAEEKAIQIHLSIPDEFRVIADPGRMGQVLSNLMDNALKYTPEKGHIYLEARQNSGESIISIRDTGIGISPQELPKIWDRLYRGDQSRTKRGLGLGLSLVKAVINANKGRIDVSSELGKGSTFTIYLPESK
jgi:signal transduction histidine kinase